MILLDTHVLVWLDQGAAELGPTSRESIQRAFEADALLVSAISFWEVAMLAERRRVRMNVDAHSWQRELLQNGLQEITVDGDIGISSTVLRDLHGDPADRIVLATALACGAQLVTADKRLLDWPGALGRADARR